MISAFRISGTFQYSNFGGLYAALPFGEVATRSMSLT